jgi:hypothetical protein
VLTLSSPAGSENWTVGTIQNITWTSADVTNVKLEYSSDDKSTWEEIIASTMASAGSYSWTVPDAVSTNCFVRVSDVSNSSLNDMNETPFEISKPTTSIDDLGSDSFNLTSYPNPFSEGTTISYQLSVISDVRINIISSVGKVVESILLNNSNVGINEYYLDASEYAEGLYYILLNNNDNVLSTHKVLLIRSK